MPNTFTLEQCFTETEEEVNQWTVMMRDLLDRDYSVHWILNEYIEKLYWFNEV